MKAATQFSDTQCIILQNLESLCFLSFKLSIETKSLRNYLWNADDSLAVLLSLRKLVFRFSLFVMLRNYKYQKSYIYIYVNIYIDSYVKIMIETKSLGL